MLNDLFGETGGAIANFVLALIVVVILIFIVAWVIKKIGGGRFGATNSGQAELSIVDTLAIDPKRRLVLVRHGKVEHLLLIGGGSDEVVERSIIGGLPIAARVQASKPQPAAPEKAPEPPSRPSSKFLDRLERTSAARKQKAKDKAREAALSSTAEDDAAPSTDTATTDASAGTTAAGTVAAGSAYAAMLAATNQSEREDDSSTPANEAASTATDKAVADAKAPAEDAAASPAALVPPLPEAEPTPDPDPIDLPPLPKASSMPASPEPRALPTNEREALEQSLDAALHDSLLAPEPAKEPAPAPIPEPAPSPEPPDLTLPPLATPSFSEETKEAGSTTPPPLEEPAKSSDEAPTSDLDFNLFDDGELEREMEAALSGSTPPPSAPSPELQAQSTAAIEAELALDLNDSAADAGKVDADATTATATDTTPLLEPKEASANEGESEETDSASSSAQTTDETKAEDDKPADGLPPFKDIPIELSRPDPVAIQIPTRGPAANATSVTKADNGITGEGAEALPEGPTSPVDLPSPSDASAPAEQAASDSPTKPTSGKSADLDEEMRRLLGEIAGDPKTS